MDFNTKNVFGKRNWQDVRNSVLRNITRRWPQMNGYDLEDAASVAMLDLVDYWANLSSSVTDDTERNFAYAVTRGTWKAKDALGKRSIELTQSASLEELELLDSDCEDMLGELATEPFGDYSGDRAPGYQAPSAEDVMFAQIEHDQLLEIVNNLSPREFNEWFTDFWSGESLVDIAERKNVSPDSIRMKRNRGLERLASRATE